MCLCNRFCCAGISIEDVGVIINKSADVKSGSDCSANTDLPITCLTVAVLFTQFWDCSVDTELINRNDCAKNSFNRISIGTEVKR